LLLPFVREGWEGFFISPLCPSLLSRGGKLRRQWGGVHLKISPCIKDARGEFVKNYLTFFS